MKKIWAPALAALAAASAVQAQTTVVLYGIADGNVRLDHTSIGTLKSVGSGGQSSSRWGLRGTEDLGNGLRAFFNFEQDIDISDNSAPQGNITGTTPSSPATSTGSRLFGRRAVVGLNSTRFGEVRIGREYTPFYLTWNAADPFGSGMVGRTTNVAVGNVTRADNSVTYQTPGYVGLTAALQYRPGESTTNNATAVTRGGDLISASVTYAAQPLYVGIAYVGSRNALDNNSSQAGTGVATYDFTVAKAHLLYFYQRDRLALKRQSLAAGVTVPVASFKVLGVVARIKNQDRDLANTNPQRNDANFAGVGVSYALSRRTDLYSSAAKFWNKGNAQFLIQDSSNAGLLNVGNVPAGFDPWSMQFGVRHLF